MADRLLLKGGAVVSMDPDVGDLPNGDVLIEGDKIARVAPTSRPMRRWSTSLETS